MSQEMDSTSQRDFVLRQHMWLPPQGCRQSGLRSLVANF